MDTLSKQQKKVYCFIVTHPPSTVRDIIDSLELAPSSAYYAVDRLVKKGFVVTGLRPANGRSAAWSPSPVAKWAVHEFGAGL